MGFGYDASANGLANTGVGPLLEYATGPQNKNYEVRTSSAATQDVIASTEVKVAFDEDEAKFNFNINGNY